ncbi:insulinase family protein [Salinispirillum sp. LH 10-3-1]|uniref:Insulinase family protein n=1 Tax=Salinispirillum sp. LH 10-3-1 TaxID=2952525 RepID=A0AB38YGL1_9GAMM
MAQHHTEYRQTWLLRKGYAGRAQWVRALLIVATVVVGGCAGLGGVPSLPLPNNFTDGPVHYELDPLVSERTLSNGVRAVVKSLPDNGARPRIEIRLRVAAGSAQELESERGLAHFVEHMAFNGTASFPRNDIIRFFEAAGMTFGQDINAYTGFNETVYMLSIPRDQPALLDTAMQLLAEWAEAITFDPAAVVRERGVILEEWRAAGYAGEEPIWLQHHRLLHEGSLYAQRYPIGVREVFEFATTEQLRGYYDRWYRPELMTVVVSGVVDSDAILAGLESGIGQFEARTPAPQPVVSKTPWHRDTRYQVLQDNNSAQTAIVLKEVLPPIDYQQRTDVLSGLQSGLMMQVLNTRLTRLSNTLGSPLLSSQVLQDRLVDRKQVMGVRIVAREGAEQEALKLLAEETERLRRHGMTQDELDTAFAIMMGEYNNLARFLAGATSDVHANVLLSLLNLQLPPTTFEALSRAEQALFAELTLADINAYIAAVLDPPNQVVAAFLTASAADRLAWQKRDLRTTVEHARQTDLLPPAAVIGATDALPAASQPGWITEQNADVENGLIYWQLSNGLTAVIYPTDLERDKVYLRFIGLGGQMAIDQTLVPAVNMLSTISVQQGALGRDGVDLDAFMRSNEIGLNMNLGISRFSLEVSAPNAQLDSAVLLLTELLTREGADPVVLANQQQRFVQSYRNHEQTPTGRFSGAVDAMLYGNQTPFRRTTAADFAAVTEEQILAAQQLLTSSQTGYVLFIVGDVDTDALDQALTAHLAGVPLASPDAVSWSNGAAEWQNDKVVHTDNPNDRAEITRYYSTRAVPFSLMHYSANRVLNELLSTRLMEVVREDSGLAYHIEARTLWSLPQREQRLNFIHFSTDPARRDEAESLVDEVLSTLRTRPFTTQEVAEARARLVNSDQDVRSRNRGLLNEMDWLLNFDEPLSYFDKPERYYGGVTAELVNSLAVQFYLEADRFTAIHTTE